MKIFCLLILVSQCAFGQQKALSISENIMVYDSGLVASLLNQGKTDFYVISRYYPGLWYLPKDDSCHEASFTQFVLSRTNKKDKYEVIKFSRCGRQTINLNALAFMDYYFANRETIASEKVQQTIYISHTELYSFYEFKDGQLVLAKRRFCRECLKQGDDVENRKANTGLKTFEFFNRLSAKLKSFIN
jgi:hypothetical protein